MVDHWAHDETELTEGLVLETYLSPTLPKEVCLALRFCSNHRSVMLQTCPA